MADPRPLWEVMEESTGTVAEWGCVIRAVRDWLVPEERTLDPVWFGTVVEHESNWRQGLRALLTAEADRAQRQPVPPEQGEVQELVSTLMFEADAENPPTDLQWATREQLRRAADLLAQRHPQPVPVSERLPGPEDMTDDGEVWIENPGHEYPLADAGDYDWEPHQWILRPIGKFDAQNGLRWLPAHALPLPGEVEG